MKLGYARVSTEDQTLALQRPRLLAAGCEILRDSLDRVAALRKKIKQFQGLRPFRGGARGELNANARRRARRQSRHIMFPLCSRCRPLRLYQPSLSRA